MNKFIIAILALSFMASGCNSINKPTVRAPTQELLNQFQELPEPTIPPLELVPVPPRDEAPADATFYRLNLGDRAPIAGMLFSDSAAAFITVEYQAISQRYELVLSTQRDRDLARLTRDTSTLRLQMNTDRAKFRLIITGFDQTIQDLYSVVDEQSSFFSGKSMWTIIGSATVGTIIGIIIGVVAAN